MSLLYLSQGMTKPYVKFAFTDTSNNPVNITGCTVKFYMILIGASALTINAGSVIIDTATSGLCHYEWGATDLNTPGSYHGWAIITYADGSKQPTSLMGFDVLPQPTT